LPAGRGTGRETSEAYGAAITLFTEEIRWADGTVRARPPSGTTAAAPVTDIADDADGVPTAIRLVGALGVAVRVGPLMAQRVARRAVLAGIVHLRTRITIGASPRRSALAYALRRGPSVSGDRVSVVGAVENDGARPIAIRVTCVTREARPTVLIGVDRGRALAAV
jgi:hypothetical protein